MGGKRNYELLLMIGHKSEPLKKKAANGYTHKWTVYLKGVDDAKIENCISRVVFQLHESFDNHHRVITEPPYRVKETGYAGFELPIEVYFKNKEKPNHVVYVHNLELLNTQKHSSSHIEKVMFLNPNKEFEKCLIRTGAQAHVSKSRDKKDKSDSPPIKKRKSASALIPSKDMSKLNLQTPSNGHQTKEASNHHHSFSNSNHSSSSHQHTSKPSQQQKLSNNHANKDFMDLFGAPLVYSKKQSSSALISNAPTPNSQASSAHTSSAPNSIATTPIAQTPNSHNPSSQNPSSETSNSQTSMIQSSVTPIDPFSTLQSTISRLADGDRLQKIVDIVVEAGEWFNLTPKKFEFDLKRLDKKTLHKIEKCLH